MTAAVPRDVAGELRGLAEHLAPDLELEVYRLQRLEREHLAILAEVDRLRRELYAATVMVGELRHRATRAEAHLTELGAEEIRKARAHAFMNGTGIVQITSQGRGRFTTTVISPADVTIRVAP